MSLEYKEFCESFSAHLGTSGYCKDCDMRFAGGNAVGVAARHTYSTGHETVCEVTRTAGFRIRPELKDKIKNDK